MWEGEEKGKEEKHIRYLHLFCIWNCHHKNSPLQRAEQLT